MSAPIGNSNARKPLQISPTDKSVGQPPPHFDADLKAIWEEVVKNSPGGFLSSADRLSLELYCHLICEFRESPTSLSSAKASLLYNLSQSFGGTPGARAKMTSGSAAPKPSEKKPSKFDSL